VREPVCRICLDTKGSTERGLCVLLAVCVIDCCQDQFTGKVPLGVVPVGRTNSLAQSLCPKTHSNVAYVTSFNVIILIFYLVVYSPFNVWILVQIAEFAVDCKELNYFFISFRNIQALSDWMTSKMATNQNGHKVIPKWPHSPVNEKSFGYQIFIAIAEMSTSWVCRQVHCHVYDAINRLVSKCLHTNYFSLLSVFSFV